MSKKPENTPRQTQTSLPLPLMSEGSSPKVATASTRTRRNASSTIERTDKYKNIDDGLVPFKYSSDGYGSGNRNLIDVRDAVKLCQKAYYNFSVFRNTIDLMTEFSVNQIYFKGGSKKSREFFNALFKKINILAFQDKFFREYYRSGNVFTYRFDAELKQNDLRNLNRVFGNLNLAAEESVSLPVKYIILNPADVRLTGTLSFSAGKYSKYVTDYELERLKNPQTDEEIQLLDSLPDNIKKELEKHKKDKRSTYALHLPLNEDKVSAVFYKKQDYEPFAVPMGYPVLEDLNAKAEMKKIDMAIARTMQQAILLVTMGTDPDKGGVNQKNLEAMQKLFTNESVGRVLIADYTTKAEFIVPNISALLNSSKYEIFERDIRIGLNNILIGEGEKFANESIKVKVFIERLKQAREIFINEFLGQEIKRISKIMGFKSVPTPHFDDIDLRDGLSYSRVYTRLIELGILTPEEGLEAIEKGRLPDESLIPQSQKEYREMRDKGFFEPLIGGAKAAPQDRGGDDNEKEEPKDKEENEVPNQVGRPADSKGPREEGERAPMGGEVVSSFYSLEKVKNNLIQAQKLNLEVEKHLRSKHNKRKLSNAQKDIASKITETIIANEEPENWSKSVKKYSSNPVDHNPDRIEKVNDISYEHGLDTYLSSILCASKKEDL
jgi:ribosomal protein S15P/S13E